jgi:hypothetical protein
MRLIAPALVAASIAVAASPVAVAQDKTKAAEYFALAQSAERRSDWQAAIRNYEQAYKASPHPNVLYNIGLNYERLGKLRIAADYLLRYVDKSPAAPDRDKVVLKVRKLRERPAEIRFNSKPSGAEIYLDGEKIGTAPVTHELSGSHDVFAMIDGERSRSRRVNVEFGEAYHIELRIGSKPGRLTVRASVKDAEIQVDGVVVGRAPFSDMVDPGEHTVVVSAPGYKPATRKVEVPPQGSEQITATLEPLPGTDTAPPKVGTRLLVGGSTGGNIGTEEAPVPRLLLQLGYRAPGGRLDLLANFGLFGFGPGGVGGEARFYIAGKLLRWYVRGAAAVGTSEDDNGSVPIGFEGGIGVNLGAANPRSGYEFFAEANMQIALVGDSPDTPMDGTTPTSLLAAPLAAVRLNIPITVGLAYRFGGGSKKR